MRRILRHPTSEGGNGRIVGKLAGQSFNSREIAKMLEGNPDEQMKAVTMLKNIPEALSYVGALHKSEGIRNIAISYLENPYELLKIAKSSPYYDTVASAFEKLGDKLEGLQGEICLVVAQHSPFADHRLKALKRVRQVVAEERPLMIGGHFAEMGHGETDADIHTIIMSQEQIDETVLASSPYDADDVGKRTHAYSSEGLGRILETKI